MRMRMRSVNGVTGLPIIMASMRRRENTDKDHQRSSCCTLFVSPSLLSRLECTRWCGSTALHGCKGSDKIVEKINATCNHWNAFRLPAPRRKPHIFSLPRFGSWYQAFLASIMHCCQTQPKLTYLAVCSATMLTRWGLPGQICLDETTGTIRGCPLMERVAGCTVLSDRNEHAAQKM